jgi:predicted nucleic acid-binding protein
MKIIIDTSAVIAVITNEIHKEKLILTTKGADLIAPSSLHWEIGNAFSAMFKRGRITLDQAKRAIEAYGEIPIQFSDIELSEALQLAEELNIYAYDAYVIGCASKHKAPLVTLDRGLIEAATRAGVKVREVKL